MNIINMEIHTLVGSIAAICTTLAFLPQVIHSYKTHDLTGISLPMYSIFVIGVAFWLIYGILTSAWPIIIANIITFMLAGSVLVLKIRQVMT